MSGGGEWGIFGGSFDPPHLGHVFACLYARLVHGLDRILVIPTANHPFAKGLTAAPHRLAMTRLAFADLPVCEVLALEIDRAAREPERPSYMIDTIEELRALHPAQRFRLVAGTDVAEQLRSWHRSEEIMRLAPPAWIPRAAPGDPCGSFALPPWNSTRLRERLARGGDVAGEVPRRVLEYMAANRVYG